jgi:triosephosphate isomerase
MRRPLVAGNWKMNGTRSEARSLVRGIAEGISSLGDVDVVVCPPFILIPNVSVRTKSAGIELGGQNLDVHAGGAYTGEVAGSMLLEHGCRFVIVGHSERRALYNESDEVVAEKAAVAYACDLLPIICVGETFAERDQGLTDAVVKRQLSAVIKRNGIDLFQMAIVAYEPVWAIGTGLTATPGQAQEVHSMIRGLLRQKNSDVAKEARIVYGGSVKPDNAAELFCEADIDGGLIGGASLVAEDFLQICRAAGS